MSAVISALNSINWTDKKIQLACSGGADSTALLISLLEIGAKPSVLHVNYQLRGNESQADEKFVRRLAELHGLEIEVVFCPKEKLKGKGKNLQNEARNFRRELFNKWISKSENHVVVLGHHSNDQVETFFLQLIRGAGMWGLAGMEINQNQIIRPFITISKQTIVQFLKTKKQDFRTDSSNLNTDYLRNLFRNKLLPELVEKNPNLEQSVLFFQKVLQQNKSNITLQLKPFIEQSQQLNEISWENWRKLNETEKYAVARILKWENSILVRLNDLELASLSKQINKSSLFRTKTGFSWCLENPFEKLWEFKSTIIEKLPSEYSNEFFIISEENWKNCSISLAHEGMFLTKKSGKSAVFKLLKDAGVPLQWRKFYPIIELENEVLWIPNLAISNKHDSKKSEKLLQIEWRKIKK